MYYIVILLFVAFGVWAVVHDLKRQIQTGNRGHLRSQRNPVASNAELFDAFGIKDDPKYIKILEDEEDNSSS